MQSNLIPPTPGLSDAPDTTMSLNAARSVRWPFDTREPMGALFDRGALTRSKLQWAAEKATWPEVCRAAQRLIEELERAPAPRPALATPAATISPATRQSTPRPPTSARPAAPASADPPRYGARVVVASEYLTDQEALHGMLLAYYIAMVFAALIASLWSLSNLLRPQPLWLIVGVAAANLGLCLWLTG